MPEKWTGDVVGRMHTNEITFEDVAKELGVTVPYVSMILHSRRKPPNIQKRVETALDSIIQRRQLTNE